jgi:hypothetical protein
MNELTRAPSGRITAATQGHSPSMQFLQPHTLEWFSALHAVNPYLSSLTRQTLRQAGRIDVCSICGDARCQDFLVMGSIFESNIGATMRLCNSCRELRSRVHSEVLSPMRSQSQPPN